MAAVISRGVVQEPHHWTAYPIATGAMAPPRFAKVFMQPVTVPADSRPMSRQTAQAALIDKSAMPAASAINKAAAKEFVMIAAPASINPLPTSAVDATPQRPIFIPYRSTQRTVQKPPITLAIAPLKSTIDANRLAWPAEKPRASRR